MMTFDLRGKRYKAGTWRKLSALYAKARDASGEGSTFPTPRIVDERGEVSGHFSYNAKIWRYPPRDSGKPGQPENKCIYDPYA